VSGSSLLKHVGLPAVGPAAIVGLYFTPVLLFGCVNRGLMAVGVVLVSTVAAVVTTWKGVRLPSTDPSRSLWLLTTAILLLPAALLLGPLG
jgi:hypothetical protein